MSTFISYAQNFEDVLLWRALKHVESGFYIDIGANSPTIDSVSLAFYEKGWRGINVEPSLSYINELREQRPNDINLHAALSEAPGLLKFYDIPKTGLGTLLEDVALRHVQSGFEVKEDWVSVVTLDDVFGDLPQADVHWMKIDVEGAEKQVLGGWKSSSIRPWVVVVEGVEPNNHAESHGDWEPLLIQKGYHFVHFDGLNRYYISDQQPQLMDAFKVGPNVFDMFCLSGTATSTFTSLLTFKLGEAADQLNAAQERARTLVEAHQAAIEDWSARQAQISSELEASRDAWQAKDAKEAELAGEIRAAREALSAQETELIGEQQAARLARDAIARLESERVVLQETLQRIELNHEQEKCALQARVIETLSQYRGLMQERDAAKESFRQQTRQLSLAVAETDVLRSSKNDLLEELRTTSERLADRDEALRWAEARSQELLNSSSWKVTAPLRLLTELMRGSRKGMSLYLGETLRNLAQIPGARGIARRLVPEKSRLRRALTARTVPIGGATMPSMPLPAMQGIVGVPGSRRVQLLGRMTGRIRQENYRMESQE